MIGPFILIIILSRALERCVHDRITIVRNSGFVLWSNKCATYGWVAMNIFFLIPTKGVCALVSLIRVLIEKLTLVLVQ